MYDGKMSITINEYLHVKMSCIRGITIEKILLNNVTSFIFVDIVKRGSRSASGDSRGWE